MNETIKLPFKRLVVFDMDHTLTHAPTTESWYEFLGNKKIIDTVKRQQSRSDLNSRFLDSTISHDEYHSEHFIEIAGFSETTVDALIEEWGTLSNLIFLKAFSLVQSHIHNGDMCFVISTSFEKLAGAIARKLSIPHFVGAIAEFNSENICTGRQIGIPAFGKGKVDRLDIALHDLGLSRKSFSEFWAYSDSMHDLPLLEAATHPVATNADEDLEALAMQRKWQIIRLGDFSK